MKSIFTILIVILTSMTAIGQNAGEKQTRFEKLINRKSIKTIGTDMRLPDYRFKTGQMNLFKSTYDIKQKLDSIIEKGWNAETGQWIDSEKWSFTYYSGGDITSAIEYFWDEINGQWFEYYKEEFDYNTNGNPSEVVYYDWDDSGQWIPGGKEEYTYNDNGNVTLTLYYSWDNDSSQWIVDTKCEYMYNDDENLILMIYYNWDEVAGQWVNSAKLEYSYDDGGNMIFMIYYLPDDNTGQWVTYQKYQYSYDDNGNIILEIDYKWYDNDWITESKIEYSYDDNENMTLEVYYNWDENSGQWSTGLKYEYNYDFSYNLSNLIIPWWMIDIDNNMLVDYTGYIFDDGNWFFDIKGNYYYSEINIGVSEISGKEARIFPNPAKDFIVFDIDNVSTAVSFELYDVYGKKVLSGKVTDGKKIFIRQLCKGLYLYRLNTNGEYLSGTIVVE